MKKVGPAKTMTKADFIDLLDEARPKVTEKYHANMLRDDLKKLCEKHSLLLPTGSPEAKKQKMAKQEMVGIF